MYAVPEDVVQSRGLKRLGEEEFAAVFGEAAIVGEALAFIDELLDEVIPLRDLVRGGGAYRTAGRTATLRSSRRVFALYGEERLLPREVMAVIYNASVYCTKRYHDWLAFGARRRRH